MVVKNGFLGEGWKDKKPDGAFPWVTNQKVVAVGFPVSFKPY